MKRFPVESCLAFFFFDALWTVISLSCIYTLQLSIVKIYFDKKRPLIYYLILNNWNFLLLKDKIPSFFPFSYSSVTVNFPQGTFQLHNHAVQTFSIFVDYTVRCDGRGGGSVCMMHSTITINNHGHSVQGYVLNTTEQYGSFHFTGLLQYVHHTHIMSIQTWSNEP